MQFVEARFFTRLLPDYMNDEQFMELQYALLRDPQLGLEIPGAGGIRKLRWQSDGKGRRGGLRVLYFHYIKNNEIWFLVMYKKGEVEDLTKIELKALCKVLGAWSHEKEKTTSF